ncbi:MAG: polyphosphate kinase 2 [Aestuariibacter sp.]
MNKEKYQEALTHLQTELVQLQYTIIEKGLKVLVLFEGRDAAGKGGIIKTISHCLNPRVTRVVALPKPTTVERSQWYFQRYTEHLPSAGEMVLFDRSWYNRAGVEKVMGYCSDDEYQEFLRACPLFEEMLLNSGIVLLKYWLSVSDEEQEKRFKERINNPLKRWKFSVTDLESRTRWCEYSQAKDRMFGHTDTVKSPWYVVEADDKRRARLNCIHHLLQQIPYEHRPPEEVELPPISKIGYKRPPKHDFNWVKKVY